MLVFDLHATVLGDYRDFVRSFLTIADARIRQFVDRALNEEAHLWPDFLLQLSPSYQRGPSVDELAERGILLRETAQIFRTSQGAPFYLHQHQFEALEKARQGKSYVVTSGTGSGKSLTYFIPIIDDLLRQATPPNRTAAFIVYPMNALVNSQLLALESFKARYEAQTGKRFPVTFARYTGETRDEERQAMRSHPPQILLTNYVMLELMLVRPEDQRFLDKAGGGIRFLVFDELHTYRGRQGADVAMLIRRLKERAAAPGMIHIGTSATMITELHATPEQRRQTVANFASRFFGHPFEQQDIIEETLTPYTLGTMPSALALRQSIESLPFSATPDEYRSHPLSRWIEHVFGIEPEANGKYKRRTPITLSSAAAQLAQETGLTIEQCQDALRKWLALGGQLEREDGGRAFAFKLHQFISQGEALYATLESADQREFTLGGQIKADAQRLFVPLRFCRQCGQEYYHVLRYENRFRPHPVGFFELDEEGESGYLMLAPQENDWNEEMLPDEWRDEAGRIRPHYRSRIPRPLWVNPDGTFSTIEVTGAVKMWYQPEPFSLCLNCGEFYTHREDEFRKLASLSSEARSSATTVLATSLLRHAAHLGSVRDKLLTFTDNRQDASLQAGHFNDFIHIAVLRAALLAGLNNNDGILRADNVAQETIKAMKRGLQLRDIAKNADLDPQSTAAREVWEAFTLLTEYRLYEDLKRGWRVTQPNLEELGLLCIEYRGLDMLCENEDAWQFHPALAQKSPQERHAILRAVLDQFRRRLAIHAHILQEENQSSLRRKCQQLLNDFWGLDPDGQELHPAKRFVLIGRSKISMRDFNSLGARSNIGRYLMRTLGIERDEYQSLITQLLDLLVKHGLLIRLPPIQDHQCFQLDAACLIWRKGDGTPPPPDPIYTRRATNEAYSRTPRQVNAFFQRFYSSEEAITLARLEAREHTAQVVAPGEREKRERRFRWEDSDTTKERDLGRRLPYLVCSPTMELGIDIADLDMVHMRNVPPTPANYAQRSGRAGRQGQAGLIFTYCGALNPHDQYFFRHREEMVAGSVRPPQIDLANESLLRAHLHAMWLAEIRLSLGQSIDKVIDTGKDDLPLREEVLAQIQMSPASQEALRQRMLAILRPDETILSQTPWFNDRWLKRVLEEAPQAFDRAFDRWRELYRAAETQMIQAQQQRRRASTREEQQRAEQREQEAERQRNLLLQIDVQREESDFYPYRYLASEGFLPGYNFPALPVRAWIPRGNGEYIARPRFLAIREFAPSNIIYHEGAKWEVVAFQSPPGGLEKRLTEKKLCYTCGAFCDPDLDLCPVCNTRFHGENSLQDFLLEMPNVRTRRRENITSEEEERRRYGYNIETFYRFAPKTEGYRLYEADVVVNGQPLLHLTYAPAATLLRVNHGWRTARNPGFEVNLETGELVPRENDERAAPQNMRTETVRLYVQATQNLLLIRPTQSDLFDNTDFRTTFQYAIKRGIEHAYQLEEEEIATECIGRDEHQAILIYETSEGGSGVLRRLIEERSAMANIAATALERIHFNAHGEDLKPDCVAACYECLLSYNNQLEAIFLNRHLVQPMLLELTRGQTLPHYNGRTYDEHLNWLRSLTDPRSDLERRFLDFLAETGCRLPDDAQHRIQQPACVVDFFYEPNQCVFCDGSVHDEPTQRLEDERIRNELRERGYHVIVIRYDQDLLEQIRRSPDVFGTVSETYKGS